MKNVTESRPSRVIAPTMHHFPPEIRACHYTTAVSPAETTYSKAPNSMIFAPYSVEADEEGQRQVRWGLQRLVAVAEIEYGARLVLHGVLSGSGGGLLVSMKGPIFQRR